MHVHQCVIHVCHARVVRLVHVEPENRLFAVGRPSGKHMRRAVASVEGDLGSVERVVAKDPEPEHLLRHHEGRRVHLSDHLGSHLVHRSAQAGPSINLLLLPGKEYRGVRGLLHDRRSLPRVVLLHLIDTRFSKAFDRTHEVDGIVKVLRVPLEDVLGGLAGHRELQLHDLRPNVPLVHSEVETMCLAFHRCLPLAVDRVFAHIVKLGRARVVAHKTGDHETLPFQVFAILVLPRRVGNGAVLLLGGRIRWSAATR
mmetsp:Transcript_7689/g.20972  ORF Transcript_7689/g.20972 Transcript_7689/m.20972 type:complete len:256 (+) Transcript_7689:743-1510(+)